ncbi:MAG TPA: biopolymer transporter ExbD [Sulfuriferula sp.]|uniref:Biopolymer transport protein ExbD/TolR n=1 Tax=Sulfuriferula multivorans TaxID=1559896 RepID=A0A401JEX8_9PROT|nr:biopolymer transporter ExbD [Sulfuriferula multivorans]GBL46181.1 biopolymer transport protein ExbD/TolR [Sulfuriferula multivorans]HUW27846.1 biopolymer transporter ExbD [Sulfuriferula sp.]
MKLRKARVQRKGRIEIIPMIDVMFFLLATFMLASLSMQSLNSLKVNLPQGKAERLSTETPVTLSVTADGKLFINRAPVSLSTLAATLKPLMRSSEENIVVSADSKAPQGVVVQAMLQARAAGAQHFLIAVAHE